MSIGMIFQDPMTSLNPTLTVGTQITETLRRHLDLSADDARKRAIELLENVRIPDAARRLSDYPHRFSGGMRQRVMIAMAISCNPKLLIADEPTTALDVTVQAGVLDLLDELRTQLNMTMMMISHNMGVVAETADDISSCMPARWWNRPRPSTSSIGPSTPIRRHCSPRSPISKARTCATGDWSPFPGAPRPALSARCLPLRCPLPVRRNGRLRSRATRASRDPFRALGSVCAPSSKRVAAGVEA